MNDLTIQNLSVSYDESILEDFNLTIHEGELVVILGPSGCGKSTLLSAISGLKKPDEGAIRFGDKCLYDDKDRINVPVEARNIGFVFQSYALWPHMSVHQNIAFPLKVRKYSCAKIKSLVSEVLEVVDMADYASRYPNELSGGEKQRIALARSLVYKPSLLLLDEPLANLDANLKGSLIREIKAIQQKLGITMIYVTHDQAEAFEIADRIVIMKSGVIMQQGSPREVYGRCKNLFVADFIGKNNIFKTCDRHRPCFLQHVKACKNAVSIRPEDIEITKSGAYQGMIKEIRYKGDRTECIIEANNTRLMVYTKDDHNLKEGMDVAFDIKRYNII